MLLLSVQQAVRLYDIEINTATSWNNFNRVNDKRTKGNEPLQTNKQTSHRRALLEKSTATQLAKYIHDFCGRGSFMAVF
jgi:hypothetical protein